MPKRPKRSRDNELDRILGRCLLSAETMRQHLIDKLADDISVIGMLDEESIIFATRRFLQAWQPLLAEHLTNATIITWLAGYGSEAAKLPPKVQELMSRLQFWRDRDNPPPVPGLFGMESPDAVRFPRIEKAVETLIKRGLLTRPQYDQLTAAAKQQAFTVAYIDDTAVIGKIRDALAESAAEGATLKGFREKIVSSVGDHGLTAPHVETIFRTNLMSAFRDGKASISENPIVKEVFRYRMFSATHDGRVRDSHLAFETLGLNSTAIFREDDPVWDIASPPLGFNCLLPEIPVQGTFVGGFESWYDGEAVEITTRCGDRFSVTANHPVLTPKGFVPAHAIDVGQGVFHYGIDGNSRVGEGGAASKTSLVRHHKQDRPVPVKEVFRSLKGLGFVTSLPSGADDFHGDAARGNGYVDVVGSVCELLGDIESERVLNRRGKDNFLRTNQLLPCESRRSKSRLGFQSDVPPHVCLTDNLAFPGPCFWAESPPSELPGLTERPHLNPMSCQRTPYSRVTVADLRSEFDEGGSILIPNSHLFNVWERKRFGSTLDCHPLPHRSRSYAGINEVSTDCRFSDGQRLRNAFESLSGLVSSDQVIHVRKFHFTGHVYDLQSETGLMVAASTIVSNCRCSTIALRVADAARYGVKEAQETLRTGRPPANPEWCIDKVSWRPDPGFGVRHGALLAST